ncbi:hypothetical protein SCP_0300660 [Sparassis crispa]|uniref:Uncharacterized protein n=1 Tax=Sparassis crispa TaxID=139825 RepID=A0A401GDY9_9APHY|nr:hypothetical protein SCP_0300660 [Sparassis crispa]GBE80351.1 hypothetical protein SCP_0300660 [Sparassis crispa]
METSTTLRVRQHRMQALLQVFRYFVLSTSRRLLPSRTFLKKGGESQNIFYDLGGGTFDVYLLSIDEDVFKVLATAGDTHLGDSLNRCLQEPEDSRQQSTRLEIESFESDNDFSEMLTRAKFQELNMDLLRKTMRPIEQVLKDANLKKEDTDESAEDREHKEPSQGISPNEAVAYVVALQDGILSRDESLGHVVLVNVCP